MLKLRGIHKSYGHLDVLKGIDLDIESGHLIGIVGKSGTGKSTLLHVAGTLDRPDAGTIEIDGTLVSAMSTSDLATYRNKHIGFIFQSHHLLPEFTAIENVMMPMLIGKQNKRQARQAAAQLLDAVEMSHREDHRPAELSGGEQQRVAVARALINRPKLVFADEPTGNLDSETSQQVHELFVRLNAELGQTFIIVTHSHALADICHSRIVMADGKIQTA